jgi:hypothetical protein
MRRCREGVVTLKHGEIAKMSLAPMTMGSDVADKKMLSHVKVGDKGRGGVAAGDTRRAARLRAIWRVKARDEGRLRTRPVSEKSSPRATRTRETALAVWVKLAQALVKSHDAKDRQLAGAIAQYVQQTPAAIEHMRKGQRELPGMQVPSRAGPERVRTGPEIER